jgi:hypothetical protein
MKNPFALALAIASLYTFTFGAEVAFAQAVETVPSQTQYTDTGENLAKTLPKSAGDLTPYQIQEQAIQKSIADNAAANQKVAESFPTENLNNNWSSSSQKGSGAGVSKVKGMASMAGRVLARTAQATLPAAGMVLLGTAMYRGAMMGPMGSSSNMVRRPGYGMSPFAGNGGMQNYSQLNAMQNGGMANYAGMPNYAAMQANGYGMGYVNNMYTGH